MWVLHFNLSSLSAWSRWVVCYVCVCVSVLKTNWMWFTLHISHHDDEHRHGYTSMGRTGPTVPMKVGSIPVIYSHLATILGLHLLWYGVWQHGHSPLHQKQCMRTCMKTLLSLLNLHLADRGIGLLISALLCVCVRDKHKLDTLSSPSEPFFHWSYFFFCLCFTCLFYALQYL